MSAIIAEGTSQDLSNPNSLEETRFLLHQPLSLFGKRSLETQGNFWNKRLFQVQMTFEQRSWIELCEHLRQEFGEPWQLDSLRREGYWGTSQQGVSTYQSGQNIVVTVYDNTQKDFHWQDMFQGVLLYVIGSIVGLFVLYALIAYLLTSFCPRCKSFGMVLLDGVERSNPTAYYTDSSLFSRSVIEYDTTYTHKCKYCGYVRKDTYGGWWKAYNAKQ